MKYCVWPLNLKFIWKKSANIVCPSKTFHLLKKTTLINRPDHEKTISLSHTRLEKKTNDKRNKLFPFENYM